MTQIATNSFERSAERNKGNGFTKQGDVAACPRSCGKKKHRHPAVANGRLRGRTDYKSGRFLRRTYGEESAVAFACI